MHIVTMFRDSHLKLFYKESMLKNFAKFFRKTLAIEVFFSKTAGLQPEDLK